MKKFVFSMERILSYKEQMLEKEKLQLAQLVAAQNILEEKILQIYNDFEQNNSLLQGRMKSGTTISEINSLNFLIENLKHNLKARKSELKLLISAVEQQRKVVVAANQDFKILEKLKEKQQAEYDYEQYKKEQDELSELIIGTIARQES